MISEPQNSMCKCANKCALEPCLKIVSPAWTVPGISGPDTVLSSPKKKLLVFCWVRGEQSNAVWNLAFIWTFWASLVALLVKNLQCGRPEFDPWVGKIPWRRERLPTPVFWPAEFHGLYSPWGRKELDMTSTSEDNQSILKEISPEYSLEGLMLKLKLQYFGHLM